MLATTQVFSKGKVQAEELRGQIGERLPGAFGLFAEATGRSTAELDKALENGEVSLQDFVTFAEALLNKYEQDAEKIADGPTDAGARLEKALSKLEEQVGSEFTDMGATFQDFSTLAVTELDKTIEALKGIIETTPGVKLALTDLAEGFRFVGTEVTTMVTGLGPAVNILSSLQALRDGYLANPLPPTPQAYSGMEDISGDPILPTRKPPTKNDKKGDGSGSGSNSDLNRMRRDKERLQQALMGVQNAKDLLALETQIEQAKRKQQERQVILLEGEGHPEIRQRLANQLVGVTDERLEQAMIEESSIEVLRLQEKTLTRLAELDRKRAESIKDQVEEQKELLQGLKNRQDELERIKNKRKDPTDLIGRVGELMENGVSFSEAWDIETAIDEANRLNDTMDAAAQKQKELWEGVGQTIKSALVDTIQQAIQGTADMSEILSGLLTQVGGLFLNAGVSGLGGAFNLPGFANGGILPSTGPALVGEKGPELALSSAGQTTIVPLDEAMNRYKPTNSGASAAAGEPAGGAGGVSEGGTVVNYNGPTLRFNSEDYVPMSAVSGIIDAAAAKGAKAGQARTMGALRTSRSQRAKVGL